jgi:hypothetical protein
MTIFTFKLRLGIILGTIFWMKGIKRYNQEQDWKQISTQKTRKITTNKSKEMQFKCTLKSKFTFPQRPYILHYLQHSSSRFESTKTKLEKKWLHIGQKRMLDFVFKSSLLNILSLQLSLPYFSKKPNIFDTTLMRP